MEEKIMAVMTLLEALKYSNGSDLQKGIISTYAESELLQFLPFKDISGNSYTFNQTESLPGIGFRSVNTDWDPSVGVLNPVSESLRIGGGSIKIDKSLIQTQSNGTPIIAEQISQKTKAFRLRFCKVVIKGNSEDTPEEFDGLERRLTGDQVLDAGSTSGGDELSLDMLDLLLDAVEPEADALLMNKTMRRKVGKLVRASGSAIETVDGNFGKKLQAYAGTPILPITYDNENNQVLAFDEDDCNGDAAECTSIYAVKFGPDAFCGLQNGTIDVEDQGNIGIYRTVLVEWYVTVTCFGPRCAARLRGLKNA
jgi:hypothetical protein